MKRIATAQSKPAEKIRRPLRPPIKYSHHCQRSEGAEPLVGQIESAVEVKYKEEQGREPYTRTIDDLRGDVRDEEREHKPVAIVHNGMTQA